MDAGHPLSCVSATLALPQSLAFHPQWQELPVEQADTSVSKVLTMTL